MAGSAEQFVPEWAKGIVWYQIFPERFCNGDFSNDPQVSDQRGAYPHDETLPWRVHPWTSDWYERQPYERVNGKDIWHQIQRRRYGGDLQGILDRLDYLQDLGVTGLYLNPIFEAPSSHKYDGATYHHVDPTLGPDPVGDRTLIAQETPSDPLRWAWTSADRLFLRLVDEVHRRGMRIILDGVFNHMGTNSWAFQDVVRNQQASAFSDWFKIRSWNDPTTNQGFVYDGWYGFPELPELRQDEQGIVAGPKQYIFDATRRWLVPNGELDAGIDGWRLDVAFCIRHPFWKEWRRFVRSIHPDAYLTGEVFGSESEFASYLQGDEFDAAMNYPWAYACAEFFVQEQHRISPTEFDRRLRELRQSAPACVTDVMQNLFSSHDANRLSSHIVNRQSANLRHWDAYHRWSTARNTPDYVTRKPGEYERLVQRLVILFQMTYPGAPMVYYGDEAGMWGANDPCCRKPMVWPEMVYAAEAYLPDGSVLNESDLVSFDHQLHRYYRQLIQLRNRHPGLQRGDFQTLIADDERELYGFRRSSGEDTLVVLLNRSPIPQTIKLPCSREGMNDAVWLDLLHEDELVSPEGGVVRLLVPSMTGRLFHVVKRESIQ